MWCLCAGGDLCEVGPALRGAVPTAGGAELPCYRHPQGHGSGREVSAGIVFNRDYYDIRIKFKLYHFANLFVLTQATQRQSLISPQM